VLGIARRLSVRALSGYVFHVWLAVAWTGSFERGAPVIVHDLDVMHSWSVSAG